MNSINELSNISNNNVGNISNDINYYENANNNNVGNILSSDVGNILSGDISYYENSNQQILNIDDYKKGTTIITFTN
jgi:hypothetical protein